MTNTKGKDTVAKEKPKRKKPRKKRDHKVPRSKAFRVSSYVTGWTDENAQLKNAVPFRGLPSFHTAQTTKSLGKRSRPQIDYLQRLIEEYDSNPHPRYTKEDLIRIKKIAGAKNMRCMLDAINNVLIGKSAEWGTPIEFRSCDLVEKFHLYFSILDMNEAIVSEKQRLFPLWKKRCMNQVIKFKDKNNVTISSRVTPDTTPDDPVIKNLLDKKVGIETSGPISMSVAALMISKKGLRLRIIYKPCPTTWKRRKDQEPYPSFPLRRDRTLLTPYAGRADVDWLRDSGMSLLFMVFKLSSAGHERLERIENALRDGTFVRTSPLFRDDGKQYDPSSVGHIVCSPGNGRLISNAYVDSFFLKHASVRTVNSGPFNLRTLCTMYGEKDRITYKSAGMYAYEIVPQTVLDKRKEKYKTRCAEALLHLPRVPGCNNSYKRKNHKKYMKPYRTWPSSACVLLPATDARTTAQ